jgi:hypothetical protein
MGFVYANPVTGTLGITFRVAHSTHSNLLVNVECQIFPTHEYLPLELPDIIRSAIQKLFIGIKSGVK